MKVLELFSGVGGMHFALEKAGIQSEVVAAIDISDVPVLLSNSVLNEKKR